MDLSCLHWLRFVTAVCRKFPSLADKQVLVVGWLFAGFSFLNVLLVCNALTCRCTLSQVFHSRPVMNFSCQHWFPFFQCSLVMVFLLSALASVCHGALWQASSIRRQTNLSCLRVFVCIGLSSLWRFAARIQFMLASHQHACNFYLEHTLRTVGFRFTWGCSKTFSFEFPVQKTRRGSAEQGDNQQ